MLQVCYLATESNFLLNLCLYAYKICNFTESNLLLQKNPSDSFDTRRLKHLVLPHRLTGKHEWAGGNRSTVHSHVYPKTSITSLSETIAAEDS